MSKKFGPTGRHPFGKNDESDDGEISMGIASDFANGTVVLNFGVPIVWIGLYPQQAKDMAAVMIKHADEILKRAS